MTWKCPACGASIQHLTSLPKPDRVYWCAKCGVVLTFSPAMQQMKPLQPLDVLVKETVRNDA